jgi:hypothetical protein
MLFPCTTLAILEAIQQWQHGDMLINKGNRVAVCKFDFERMVEMQEITTNINSKKLKHCLYTIFSGANKNISEIMNILGLVNIKSKVLLYTL